MSYAPTTILYDANGNPISVIDDSGVYRLTVDGKLKNTSNAYVNPATEDKQDTIITNQGTIEADLETIAGDTTSIDGKVATSAKQDTMIANQGTMEADLETIAGDTTSIDGKVATSAKQDTIIANQGTMEADLETIAGDTTSIDGKVATSAKQDTMIANQGTIETDLEAINAAQTNSTQKTQIIGASGDSSLIARVLADDRGDNRLFVNSKDANAALADDGQVFLSIIDNLNLGVGANEKNIFYLVNPVSSGVNMQLKEIVVSSVKTSSGTNMRYYRDVTTTANGTSLTISNKRDDVTTGEIVAYQLPTVTAYGTKLGVFGVEPTGQLNHTESYEVRIPEGSNMLVTLEPAAANQTFSIVVVWAELSI